MFTLSFRRIVIFLVSMLICDAVLGQKRDEECEVCKSSLVKDVLSTNSSYQSRLYQLDMIDEKTFEQVKHSADWGSILPIWSFNGSYSDFSEKRREYFRLMNFRSDQANSYQQLKIFSSERAYNSFDKCIELCFQSKSKDNLATIVLYKIKDNISSTIVRLRYVGNDFAYPKARVTIKCRSGKFLATNETEKTIDIDRNTFKDFEFSRYESTVDVEAYVNGNLYDQIISKYERPEAPKQFSVKSFYSKTTTETVKLPNDFWVTQPTVHLHEVSSDNCNFSGPTYVSNPNRGKWCFANYTIKYPENFGGNDKHYLRNCETCYFGEIVKTDCEDNDGACGWNAGVFNETFRFEKSSDSRNFTIYFTAGSRAITYRFHISVYRKETKTTEHNADVKNYGRIVLVTIPNSSTNSYLVVNRNGIGRTVYINSFGSKDFTIEDLTFRFIGSYYESGNTVYQYRVY